jgi:hypothetical protein
MAFTITIDDKLNLIIVLLIVVLWYVMFVREGYATTLECAACLQKLDKARACTQINGYFIPQGCDGDASANKLLIDSRIKYGSNLCNTLSPPLPCDGGEPAPPRGDCTAATQFVFLHNEDGSIYTDEFGNIVPQEAQCPEKNAVVDKQVSDKGEESLFTYKCCPL